MRTWLLRVVVALAFVATAGCADLVAEAQRAPVAQADDGGPLLRHSTAVVGGFIAPTPPALGVQARPGTGMYVKLLAPGAVALRGQEMLVADLAGGRLWRADLAFNTLTPIAAAPVAPGMAVMMDNLYEAWVLDPATAQVLRFRRDGRLRETWRAGFAAPAPNSMALVDGGVTLLLADTTLAQWAELRNGGAMALPVRPLLPDGTPVRSVAAIAAGRRDLFILDVLGGAVHRVQRDGTLVETLPGSLPQPAALAVDRYDRVFVLDALGRNVTVLRSGAEPLVLSASELRVQQIGGMAVDENRLAVSDRLMGQVMVHTLAPGVLP